jgi:DNA sulfur modification protein DndB
MCPLRLIPRLFLFDGEELIPELRAQRVLNKSRIPEIASYITDNTENYVFSAITASIDAEIKFEPIGESPEESKVGTLHVPLNAKFIINDGQHRRAAIERALREKPELGDETIGVVFFLDVGLKRCQQMFADLNRYAIRPSRSLGVLYDHRDDCAQLTRLIVAKSPFFHDIVEMEKTNLSPRSRKLFTLSSLYSATSALLDGFDVNDIDVGAKLAMEYWDTISNYFPEWKMVKDSKMSAGEVRQDFIHSHGIVLQALGIVGNVLLKEYKDSWKSKLNPLGKINWSRSNSRLWEGRSMIGGRISIASHCITLTANAIKKALKLELTPEDKKAENAFKRGKNVSRTK